MSEDFPAQTDETQAVAQARELDLSTDEFTDALAAAPVYAKTATVRAREAEPGEKITTVLENGTEETVNTAGEGDWVITNPGGEEYIIGGEKFAGRYESTDEEGVFRATGKARAVQNPTGGNIRIMAPWGEEQVGDAQAMIATTFDPEHPEEIGPDRYLIAQDEFQATYAPVEVAQPQPGQPEQPQH